MSSATRPAAPGVPFAALWFVSAPWAHLVWDDYVLSLCDVPLKTGTEPIRYREDVTHELIVWAVDQRVDVFIGSSDPADWELTGALLQPANHCYQFGADTDQVAFDRVNELVELIERRRLSPDTDSTAVWDCIFMDGISLKYQEPPMLGLSLQQP